VNWSEASTILQGLIEETRLVPVEGELPDNISEPNAPGLAKGESFEGDPLAKQEALKFVSAYYRLPSLELRNTVRKLVRILAG